MARLTKLHVQQTIRTIVAEYLRVDVGLVTPTTKFTSELGIDSLDAVEIIMALEDFFGISIDDGDDMMIRTLLLRKSLLVRCGKENRL